jgi:hypothetical protein
MEVHMIRAHARFLSLTVLWAIVLVQPSAAQKKLTASEAKNHLGEVGTVCGVVASAKYAAGSRGRPTFLNLDEPYPREIFTVVIWGSDRSKFGAPEGAYFHKNICVSGEISQYRGVPQIVANDPKQIGLN